MDLWCWAAVSASVDDYFDPPSDWTQCDVAGELLGTNCCPKVAFCDQTAFLEDALEIVGHLRAFGPGILSFDDIRGEIQSGMPVAARIQWDGGGGHFVVISGYRVSNTGEQLVMISDSMYPSDRWLYDEFVFAYQSEGQWSHTYLLEP
jgi:hypothetical protein